METNLIIPYLQDMDEEAQLKVAIASWLQNFNGKLKIYVIGDDPKIEGVEHMPLPSVECPEQKLFGAVTTAIMNEDISDEFIVAMPNVFVANKINAAHVLIRKGYNKFPTDLNDRVNNSLQLLYDKGVDVPFLPCFDIPFMVNKFKWADIMDQFPEWSTDDLDMSVIYQALTSDAVVSPLDWRTDCWLLPVVKDNTNPQDFEQFVKNKAFVSCTLKGWNPTLKAWAKRNIAFVKPVEKIKK